MLNSSGVTHGSQAANSIVINSSAALVTGATASATYIAPVRNITQTTVLGYDTTSNEVTYYATPSGGSSAPSFADTNLLYDDFMSCPSNNPNTPLGPMGIQASTTNAFLSPYTGTKIPGYSGVIQMLNPSFVAGTVVDILNSQPFAFDNLATGASVVPLGMTHKFFADGVNTLNVIQYIGVFSTPSTNFATMSSTFPNVYITVNYLSGTNGQLSYFLNGVNTGGGPFTVAMSTISAWYNFGIRRTAPSTFQLLGLFGTSGTYTNTTAPMYLRCGSYTTASIGQTARIYVDSCNVQLNTR
jgi:hypothetical protein